MDHAVEQTSPTQASEAIQVEIDGNVQDLSTVLYLNPFVAGDFSENPFNLDERKYPIDFRVPLSLMYTAEIEIPETFEVTSVPEPLKLSLPNKAGSVIYSVNAVGNRLIVNQVFKIRQTNYQANDYPVLKEFYAQIVEKDGEQIVLKRKGGE